ncbi:hypothetical protein B0J13DRAFT_637659 [Dactylonectria estremocensis]|uniref:Cell wall protein PhiA n=1 Tax=Dactylonectria estremocensis TaxID=1079267 RepID=A0A9P9EM85_9HYPO|nr:hypothetical protein B0J13DRAFT_637659 [Dactylonectria estremocensis]
MLAKNFLFAPLFAVSITSAATIPLQYNFELLTVAPTTEIHFSGFQAASGRIALDLEDQDAVCGTESDNLATFSLVAGSLWLYQKPKLLQQLYVDRSAAGQGRLGYTTSPQESPARVEKTGWRLDSRGNLRFRNSGFIACPGTTEDGPWTIWVDVGTDQPGGGTGCVPLEARTITLANPNSCEYTDGTTAQNQPPAWH